MNQTKITSALWPEERIRRELRRLDRMTGLNGAELPIYYFRGKRRLAEYAGIVGRGFGFSVTYMDDPRWSEQSALDVIRHEYAHYMDHVQNGTEAPPFHGAKWKACCRAIGCVPMRSYREDVEMGYKKKNLEAASTAIRCGAYEVGRSILHPSFGRGMIIEANGEGVYRILTVKFASVGNKRLGAEWVDKNCTKC